MKSDKVKIIFAFAAVYILWGSTYLAIRIAIETIPPFLMAGTRFVTAGALLYFWAAKRENVKLLPVHWLSAFIVGAFLLLGGNGGVVWAEQLVPSGITALIVATVPLWTVLLISVWEEKKTPSFKTISGIILGFSGLWYLVDPANAASGIHPLGASVLLMATLSWSIGSIYARKAPLPQTNLMPTAMEMIAGGALLLIAGTVAGEWTKVRIEEFSIRSILALAYLIFFGALVGFTAYKYILKHTSPTLSSTYAYINPVIAVLLGWLVAGEPLNPRILTGAAVILAGVFLITVADGKKTAGQA